MIRIIKWARSSRLIVEIVIGVHRPAIPPIDGISVPIIGSGLSHEVDVGSSQAPILSGVTIVNDRGFLNVVLAEQQICGARVI
jgi:hypothetical protein